MKHSAADATCANNSDVVAPQKTFLLQDTTIWVAVFFSS
jgi:hypothetical protein